MLILTKEGRMISVGKQKRDGTTGRGSPGFTIKLTIAERMAVKYLAEHESMSPHAFAVQAIRFACGFVTDNRDEPCPRLRITVIDPAKKAT